MNYSIENLVRQLHDTFSRNEFEKTAAFATDDVVVESHAMGAAFKGKEAFHQFMQGFKSAFPDMVIHHQRIFSNGTEVAVEFTATGTHTGDLHTPAGIVPPTGKSVVLNVCECQTWENGKLKSIRNYQDSTSLMRQLGLLN